MLKFKKELNELINSLIKENNDFSAKTGTCYEYGGIFYSFYNQSKLFNDKAIEFVENNLDNDFLFVEIQTSLINNLENDLASLEFELKESNARIEQLNCKQYILFNGFFDPLSNTSGKRNKLKSNWQTINSYRSKNIYTSDRIKSLKNEIKNTSEITNVSSLSYFFNEVYLPDFLSNISSIKKPAEEKIEYIKEFFFHYKSLNAIAISRGRMVNIKKYLTDHSEELIKIYRHINIDLDSVDSQFKKYKLISLNENISITNKKYNRYLTDNRLPKINLHFFTSKKVVDSITKMLKEGLIKNIAFRISGISRITIVMEELAYGSIMPSEIDRVPEISVLYDKKYDDKLIIQHDKDKQEITFEELMDDFILEEDSVVTQVIHLQYVRNDGQVFIQHLDHEFIFYSIEEYEQKINNHKIHGDLNKIKTFKIDNSKIPFHYRDMRGPFLFNVLESHFIHKDLICEYFNEALC